MIEIQLVRIGKVLFGRRFQDMWNLEQMRIVEVQADTVEIMRQRLKGKFTLTTVNGEQVAITDEERALFPKRRTLAA